ncbi:PaaX family transcriptional regulator C-terminal domain-containing protein [Tropicibacter sp. Alg240-R139]|uniref:PaaX family transcriptional regulator C-terminal domain-containing protein n=1 Tax=Tropicibacter sp. Alg240-R139 TaxID=2305991 RepID=UPI0013DE94BA|nr:PaaX family transcriptional regulator C-terminal domain-containing protein [Tropicibacter sp. Alg240-R139]
MTIQDQWFDGAILRLADPQNQRVWSIIVSLFGDLAQGPDDRISGAALTRIIQPMHVKPEAIRVALHRLRKDGWVDSARSGRSSVHHLTEFGRAQSAAVTPRIYDRDPDIPHDWHLLMSEGSGSLDDLLLTENYISIGRNAALGSGAIPPNCDDMVVFNVTARNVPSWLKSRLCPPDLIKACGSLADAVKDVPSSRPAELNLTAAQVATLRTLIVHRWRRVALRNPDLPPMFFPDDWRGQDCRASVFALLDTLPKPDLNALNAPV